MANEPSGGAAHLKRLRATAGLTQEQLAELAGLHVRTIRGLETDHVTSPRRESLSLIGRALGLDVSGQLRLLAAWGLPDVGTVVPATVPTVDAESSVIDRFLDGSLASCTPVALSETVTVGENRVVLMRRTEEVVVALRTGVSVRHVFYEPRDESVDVERLHLSETENCQVVREFADSIRRVKVFELALGRTLNENDSHVIRYAADFGSATMEEAPGAPGPARGEEIGGFFRPPSSYLLEVRFHERAVPARCTQVFLARPTGPTRTVASLKPSTTNAVHIALVNPKPGGHGIVWNW